jgi:hypothetical protein
VENIITIKQLLPQTSYKKQQKQKKFNTIYQLVENVSCLKKKTTNKQNMALFFSVFFLVCEKFD